MTAADVMRLRRIALKLDAATEVFRRTRERLSPEEMEVKADLLLICDEIDQLVALEDPDVLHPS